MLSPECLAKGTTLDDFPLGDSADEICYRRWCLRHRLFLNPLNDLGEPPIAAGDVVTAPSIAANLNDGPHFHGFFNQLKQEFVSARFMFYDGKHARTPHFSDKDVLLYNTLDYPSYSLAAEKTKAAFRIAYSVFDKVAFFLNHYLGLGIPERAVGFRSFWYVEQRRQKGLRPEFEKRENWPLRGLFWLSKDLFEDDPAFTESLEPTAQEVALLRNHAEHKYLKLHEMLLFAKSDPANTLLSRTDALAFSVRRSEFEDKTLWLLKTVRAALIYLCFTVHAEERRRHDAAPKHKIVVPMPLTTWEDRWKV
jgi:hypothetical protein